LQHNNADFGMFKPHPLDDIGQLYIDAKVVGVQLQLITIEQTAILVDIHMHPRHRAVIFDAPMPVLRRIGLEIDHVAHRNLPDYRRQPFPKTSLRSRALCIIVPF